MGSHRSVLFHVPEVMRAQTGFELHFQVSKVVDGDWIGLYRADTDTTPHHDTNDYGSRWFYVTAENAKNGYQWASTSGARSPGLYEFRYLDINDEAVHISPPFLVEEHESGTPYSRAVSFNIPENLVAGTSFHLHFSVSYVSDGDWIGMYRADTKYSHHSTHDYGNHWTYVRQDKLEEGINWTTDMGFKLPGLYEFRYLDGGDETVFVSSPFELKHSEETAGDVRLNKRSVTFHIPDNIITGSSFLLKVDAPEWHYSDWIGLYRADTETSHHESSHYSNNWYYVPDNAGENGILWDGSKNFFSPGYYEFRYFGFYWATEGPLHVSAPFLISDRVITFQTPAEVKVGEDFCVSFAGHKPRQDDWVGIYPAGSTHITEVLTNTPSSCWYQVTEEKIKSGIQWEGRLGAWKAGSYELRYFQKHHLSGYHVIAVSEPFTASGESPIKVNFHIPEDMKVGEHFLLKFEASHMTEHDWIGLFPVGFDANSDINFNSRRIANGCWYRANQSRLSSGIPWEGCYGPWQSGMYEFRYFGEHWESRGPLHVSNPFAVIGEPLKKVSFIIPEETKVGKDFVLHFEVSEIHYGDWVGLYRADSKCECESTLEEQEWVDVLPTVLHRAACTHRPDDDFGELFYGVNTHNARDGILWRISTVQVKPGLYEFRYFDASWKLKGALGVSSTFEIEE